MKKILSLSSLLLASTLLLAGCVSGSTETESPSDPTQSGASESPTTSPDGSQESEQLDTVSVSVELLIGEQFRLPNITPEDALNITPSYSSNGVVNFVRSEEAAYEPFLVGTAIGESRVYLSNDDSATPLYTFDVVVSGTPEEIALLKEARDLASTLKGLSEDAATALITDNGNDKISYSISKIEGVLDNELEYDLGRIIIYINAAGNVEYAGVG